MNGKKSFTTYDIVVVGLMAAVCFVSTYFFKLGPIPTPAGPTMIKLGNGFCLLAALLFGRLRGGLAAGIGCMIFDLLDPVFISTAPFTLVFYFVMAYVCGAIAHGGGRGGRSTRWNTVAASVGALTYLVLHLTRSLVALLLEGSGLTAALVSCGTKLVTSGINAVAGVVVAVLLAPVFAAALRRAGLDASLSAHHM